MCSFVFKPPFIGNLLYDQPLFALYLFPKPIFDIFLTFHPNEMFDKHKNRLDKGKSFLHV